MTQKEKEDFGFINTHRFCEKEILSDKVRDDRHLTGKNRGPAHSKCNIDVRQKQNIFLLFVFDNFSKYGCHIFFKKYLTKRKLKLNFKVFRKQTKNIYQLHMDVLDLLIVIDFHQVARKN